MSYHARRLAPCLGIAWQRKSDAAVHCRSWLAIALGQARWKSLQPFGCSPAFSRALSAASTTFPLHCWWVRALTLQSSWMGALIATGKSPTALACTHAWHAHAPHALTGLVARARRYSKDGSCIDMFGRSGRYWQLGSLVRLGPRPTATCFAMRPPRCRENASRVIDLLSRTYRVWLTRSMLAPLWSLTGSIPMVVSVIDEQCEYPG